MVSFSLEEKVKFLTGLDFWQTNGLGKYNTVKMSDGPFGVKGNDNLSSALFPCGPSLGSTFNPELVYDVGRAIGEECNDKAVDVLLGPNLNLYRDPLGGRNFEMFSEDPILTGSLGVAYIKGVQSQGVTACAKHLVCNEIETDRMTRSFQVEEPELRKTYLKPFEMAVKEADVGMIMTAYNKLNNIYCSANKPLIDIVKNEWAFDGVVVSDWGGAVDSVACANAGLDLMMPGPRSAWSKNLYKDVKDGLVSEEILDDKIHRLKHLASIAPDERAPEVAINSLSHRQIARSAAAEGMVLLKNDDNILPLKPNTFSLIGPAAETPCYVAGGSSKITPHYTVSPLDAMPVPHESGCSNRRNLPSVGEMLVKFYDLKTDELLHQAQVEGNRFDYMEGFAHDIISSRNPYVKAVFTTTVTTPTAGRYEFETYSTGKSYLRLNGKELIANDGDKTNHDLFMFGASTQARRVSINLPGGGKHQLEVEFTYIGNPNSVPCIGFGMELAKPNPINAARKLAEKSDNVVLVVGTTSEWESEGFDRKTTALPGEQVRLIKEVAKANPNTIVVINSGGPVDLEPWFNDVKAVIQAWMPGQEFGNALKDILTGAVNPSGKLPITISPLLPFGYGQSYTTFKITDHPEVKVVTNTGDKPGAEVVFIYDDEGDLERYIKVFLEPGEQRSVLKSLDK